MKNSDFKYANLPVLILKRIKICRFDDLKSAIIIACFTLKHIFSSFLMLLLHIFSRFHITHF
ncbi:MAG: hypothetical protein J6J39_01160, partial [Clostridia bacterium]|nr:hypothetical protein [Clostridia bacterium]